MHQDQPHSLSIDSTFDGQRYLASTLQMFQVIEFQLSILHTWGTLSLRSRKAHPRFLQCISKILWESSRQTLAFLLPDVLTFWDWLPCYGVPKAWSKSAVHMGRNSAKNTAQFQKEHNMVDQMNGFVFHVDCTVSSFENKQSFIISFHSIGDFRTEVNYIKDSNSDLMRSTKIWQKSLP